MCFSAFLLGILAALLIGAVVLILIGRRSQDSALDDKVATMQCTVEDLIDELNEESEEYLEELRKAFSK